MEELLKMILAIVSVWKKNEHRPDELRRQTVAHTSTPYYDSGMNHPVCIWYDVCPMKHFYEAGKLEESWIVRYCRVSNPACVRRQMESKGISHPDNMLPDGTIREDLF